jgi:hypothetical protein
MQLDLFTPLKDGPLTAAQLAQALGVRADKLQPLLYALVTAGLLMVEGELFSNTPEADQFLVRGKPSYVGIRHETFFRDWIATLKTAESIRTGFPQAKVDFAGMSQAQLEPLYRSYHPASMSAGRDLLTRYDFSGYRRLLEVAGGSGGLSIVITKACPHLSTTVVELPAVTPITQRYVAEAGMADRIRVVAADVVHGPVSGTYDAAVMRAFVQVLSPERARRALRNIAQVIVPGGWIYILGRFLDNSRLSPVENVYDTLNFSNRYDEGQSYTEQEYGDWLEGAGFTEAFQRLTLSGGIGIIRAMKPGLEVPQ